MGLGPRRLFRTQKFLWDKELFVPEKTSMPIFYFV